MQGTAAAGGGKGIGHGALCRNLTPLRIRKAIAAVHRHSTLIEFLAISQDVLAHLAQVDVEIATIIGSISLLSGIDERIEHPELDILHVGLLEIIGVQLTHHSAPVALRILQGSIWLEVSHIEVVRSWLARIVSQVEHAQRIGGPLIGALVAQWEKLFHIDLTHIVIAQLLQVALDMARSERTASASEQWVDGIPCHARAMETTGESGLVVVIVLEIERRHTGEHPRCRRHHVDGALGILKVVDIRGIVLRATRLARNQLGKLARKGDVRWLGNMEERHLVEHIGEPLALLLPVQVDAPKGVVERFGSHRHLVGQRLLREMLQGTAHLEILGEVILQFTPNIVLRICP